MSELLAVNPKLVGKARYGGLETYCVGYAADGAALVYFSSIGPKAANRALWAALMEGGISVAYQNYYRLRDTPYLHTQVSLPESGGDHLVILSKQASLQMEPGKDFYVLSATSMPPYQRFYALLDRALVLPLRPEWAELVWKAARGRELIEPQVRVSGCAMWLVKADVEKWTELLQTGIKAGKLK